MNKSINRGLRSVLASIAVASIVTGGAVALDQADAVTSSTLNQSHSVNERTEHIRSRCDDLWMHDHTVKEEDTCRAKGWHIGWRYNLSPNFERIWTGVAPCDGEDSRGEIGCYWDAKRRGNHHGQSFVYLRHLGYFYVSQINGRHV